MIASKCFALPTTAQQAGTKTFYSLVSKLAIRWSWPKEWGYSSSCTVQNFCLCLMFYSSFVLDAILLSFLFDVCIDKETQPKCFHLLLSSYCCQLQHWIIVSPSKRWKLDNLDQSEFMEAKTGLIGRSFAIIETSLSSSSSIQRWKKRTK